MLPLTKYLPENSWLVLAHPASFPFYGLSAKEGSRSTSEGVTTHRLI
jgi:hypothetical protein